VVAGFLRGAAEVSLRRPVPLGSPLAVVCDSAESVRLLDGGALVAEGHSVRELDVEVPAPVSLMEARLAATRYKGPAAGRFCRCFVCGRAREDAFGVFAREVAHRELVASPWTPPAWAADAAGLVRSEFVWAVLDCPTYFALLMTGELPISILARLTARLDAPVVAGVEHVVIAWPLEIDGRKRHAGAAVLSADGHPLAVARALLIEPRPGELTACKRRTGGMTLSREVVAGPDMRSGIGRYSRAARAGIPCFSEARYPRGRTKHEHVPRGAA
jgi:hypothetical protein